MTRRLQKLLKRVALAASVCSCTAIPAFAVDELSPEMQAQMNAKTEFEQSFIEKLYDADTIDAEIALAVTSDESSEEIQPVSCNESSGGVLGGFKSFRKDALCNPDPWWAHRSGVFGELLFLTPGSSDIIHAIEQTDPDPTIASPTGPVGIVAIDAEPGVRVGFSLAASHCSSLNVAYTWWEGSANDVLNATGANVLDSQVAHPSLATSGAASLSAEADHDVQFQTVDANYRHLWKRTETMAINWSAGLRYANMEQGFVGQQTMQVATGLTTVTTDIDFNGFGITGGLDLERYSCRSGMFIYGKGMASLLAGTWEANYSHVNQLGGGVTASEYEDFHATPILEGEVGLGWMNKTGRIRAQTGFMMAGWYEAVSTRGYIDAVRESNLIDLGETMTFSGLTSRVALRY
ncbi:MAG: Lpg1974 family pore-forming outer membrane protein [Planctomycetota bacterium]